MCSGKVFPAWQAEAIGEIQKIANVEISLLIVKEGVARSTKRPLSRLLGDPGRLIWNLYNKGWVQRRSTASRPVDLSDELSGTAEIRCSTVPMGKYGEGLNPTDVNDIRDQNLDVILRFGFGILKGDVLGSARYGIWSFHHGDERVYRGQPPGFWETYEKQPVGGAILQRITERLDGGVVLHRGFFRLTPHSYPRSRDDLFLGAADFASIVIRKILDGDERSFEAGSSTTNAPLRYSPGNVTMIRFFIRQVRSFLREQWIGLTKAAVWSVGTAHVPVSRFLEDDLPTVEWVSEPGKTRYLADPFLDPSGATSFVLVEDYDYQRSRGVISAVDVAGNGQPRMVLDLEIHASYPFLVEHDGEIFCIPETYQAGEVRIFKAIDFPDRWKFDSSILPGLEILDPTIFRHEGRWWLFCSMYGRFSNTKLFAFHSESLLEGWEPHSLNPIKTDVTSSRPGGRPFVHHGSLYRPAQDSASSYGAALAINRIDELTPTRFAETTVKRLGPLKVGPYHAGVHTLSGEGNITVIDGRRDSFILSAFRREAAGRFARVLRRGSR